jgi:hypothetical protein
MDDRQAVHGSDRHPADTIMQCMCVMQWVLLHAKA